MSKRGVEMLRTAFFQSAFSAAHTDPELRTYYQCKRAQGKNTRGRPESSHAHPHPQTGRSSALRQTLPVSLQPQKCCLELLTPVIACLHRLVRLSQAIPSQCVLCNANDLRRARQRVEWKSIVLARDSSGTLCCC
jgi:hypothetical protein